jgi:hypothetical protein
MRLEIWLPLLFAVTLNPSKHPNNLRPPCRSVFSSDVRRLTNSVLVVSTVFFFKVYGMIPNPSLKNYSKSKI